MSVILFAGLSLADAIVCLIFGTLVFLRDVRSRMNQVFMVLCVSVAYWAFTQFEMHASGDADLSQFWARANFLWPVTVALMFHFTLIFTRQHRALKNRVTYWLLYGPAAIISLLALTSDQMIGAPVKEYWGWTFELPAPATMYVTTTLAASFLAVVGIFIALRFFLQQREQIDRRLSRLVLIGLAIPVLIGTTTDVILPVLGINAPELSTTAFAIGAAAVIGYAIRKYELFDITLAQAADKIVTAMADSLLLVDPAGNVLTANQAATDLLGYEKEELIGRPAENLFTECLIEMAPSGRDGKNATFAGMSDFETFLMTKDGGRVPVAVSDSVLRDNFGRELGAVLIARDTTERRRAESELRESESRLKSIMDSVQTGIIIIEPATHTIVDINTIAASLIGAPREAIIGSVCHKYICPAEVGKCPITDLHQTVDHSERVLLTVAGEKMPIIKSVTRVMLGGKEHLLESYIDISVRKRMEVQLNDSLAEKEILVQRLNELAIRDDLTGLYNHRAFYSMLTDELTRAHRFERPVSLLMLDIDHFKNVNDTHGHLAGDIVLSELSEVLLCRSRAIDRVCRYGGEEMTVILPEADADTAFAAAERLRAAVEKHAFEIMSGDIVRLTVSIGVASWPADADSAQMLVAATDIAMFAAKERGRNRIIRYEQALGHPEMQA